MNYIFRSIIFIAGIAIGITACSESEFKGSTKKKDIPKSGSGASGDGSEGSGLDGSGINDSLFGGGDESGNGSGGNGSDGNGSGGNGSDGNGSGGNGGLGGGAGSAVLSPELESEIRGSALVKDCQAAMQAGTLMSDSTTVSFKSNAGKSSQCDWRSPENSSKIAGIKEWFKILSIPSERILCKFEMESNGSIEYDDSLLFSINDNMIFWGNLTVENLPQTEGLYRYDFDRLYNNEINRQNSCIDGATSCTIPDTQQTGNIDIKFDEITNYRLALDMQKNGKQLALRITGDDDPDIDCTQSGLNIDFRYSYIVK